MFRGELIYPLVRRELSQRFPGVRFVGHEAFGNTHGANQVELVKRLPEMLRLHGCDVVISGIGA